MNSHLNLLPEGTLRQQMIKRQVRRWLIIYLVFFIVTGGMVIRAVTESRRTGTELEAAQRRFTPVNEMILESKSFAAEIDSLQHRESLALELSKNRSLLTLLGTLSNATAVCDDNVNVQSLVVDPVRKDGVGQATTDYQMTLRGIGIDNVSVTRFELELRNSGLFDNVELTSSGATTVGEHEAFMYTIVCHY